MNAHFNINLVVDWMFVTVHLPVPRINFGEKIVEKGGVGKAWD